MDKHTDIWELLGGIRQAVLLSTSEGEVSFREFLLVFRWFFFGVIAPWYVRKETDRLVGCLKINKIASLDARK